MHARRLSSADAAALWALDQRCFAPGIAYSREEIQAALGRAGGFRCGVEQASVIAAFILTQPERGWGHIITIDVAPEYRRHGLGRWLMLAAERHHRARGARGMRLEVAANNSGAMRFYLGLDYELDRRLPSYYAGGLDGLSLLKRW